MQFGYQTMPTSDDSWTGRLRTIGELERPDHWHLEEGDSCVFFGEYTPGENWGHSSTNQLILNLKKKPSRARGTPQWPHKMRAIRDVAAAIRLNLMPEALATTLFVPIPSSKGPTHPDFDPRMLQIAQGIGQPARAAELIEAIGDRPAFHENNEPRDPEVLMQQLQVSTSPLPPNSERIILIDDMITTGCSYRACKNLLEAQYPDVPVFGLFVARRILPNPFAAFDIHDAPC